MKNYKRLFKKIEDKVFSNRIFTITCLLVLLLGIISVPRIFAQLQPVRSVEIFSEKLNYAEKEPGSWKIEKSAKWISKGTAEITFDVDTVMKSNVKYTDILFVLDVSGSMEGEKLDRVKNDATELVNSLLSNNKNRAGLITFENNSEIVSNLTNNKDELIEKINALSTTGCTNYYQALVNVDYILKDYVKEKDRECIVLFLTDGYPNKQTPNEEGQYSYLRNQYPFITINAVQYEMGSSILDPVKKISDNQYIADMNTLNNVLFEASTTPTVYENFEITDYIDTNYFYVEDEKDIEVSRGNIAFDKDNQKVTWKMDNLKSGLKANMTIKAKLKEELIGEGGLYPTNEKEEIKSKIDEDNEDVESSKTPILVDNYKVIYDENKPSGCRVEGVPAEKQHSVFDTVEISDSVPKCESYSFKGWKITTENVKMINEDYFVMPENDVKIVGNWSKLDVKKSMNGTVNEKITLFKQVQQDAFHFTYDDNVYYYTGSGVKNSVLFGGFCWKMYTTTKTGGVKMLYNGEPDSEGKCGTDRGSHVGYADKNVQVLSSNYVYGTDYVYDEVSKIFNLSGDMEQATWNAANYQNLIGKYTCKNTIGSCNTLYYVDSYYSDISANVYPINSSTNYALIGTSSFNKRSDEMFNVGYMYNETYQNKTKFPDILYEDPVYSCDLTDKYYYADSFEWGKEYSDKYNLVNPFMNDSLNDPKDLIGKYTFKSNKESYTSATIYYVVAVSDSKVYYVILRDGRDSSQINKTYYFSDSIINDANGNRILNPLTTEEVSNIDWCSEYQKYNNKYYCETSECTTIYYVLSTSDTSFKYAKLTSNYMFGNSFTYNEEKDEYTLSGETQHLYEWSEGNGTFNNTHYTCWNESGKCEKISYIHFIYGSSLYYIELEKGASVETALNDMLHNDNANVINSEIKNVIDLWYSKNMILYTDYLEDAVWCNDRGIHNIDYNGWNPNGGSLENTVSFDNGYCLYENDRFTVSKANGNGALTYPVGLITMNERYFSQGSFSSVGGPEYQWTMTPNRYIPRLFAYNYRMTSSGSFIFNDVVNYVGGSNGVRPAIVLRPDIEYIRGDGSDTNPFIIDLSNDEYKISIEGDIDVKINKTSAIKGEKIKIIPNFSSNDVISFKMNGTLIEGDSFIMPGEDVVITDITVVEVAIIESEHNPYPNNLSNKVYGEKTFAGATSLNVELDYQTESTSYDWIYLYDSTGKQYGKYGGTTRKTETITIPGDYVKVVFVTDDSVNNYYGFKASITPNYD